MFYSKSEKGFYNQEIHGANVPADSVEITKAAYIQLLEGQSRGKIIASDGNGRPVLEDPADAPLAVPEYVTRAQGKAALIRAGLWKGVLDFVGGIEDSTEKAVAEVALHDTTNWQRSSPFLTAAAHALGLTDAQLDELFVQASQIEL